MALLGALPLIAVDDEIEALPATPDITQATISEDGPARTFHEVVTLFRLDDITTPPTLGGVAREVAAQKTSSP